MVHLFVERSLEMYCEWILVQEYTPQIHSFVMFSPKENVSAQCFAFINFAQCDTIASWSINDNGFPSLSENRAADKREHCSLSPLSICVMLKLYTLVYLI